MTSNVKLPKPAIEWVDKFEKMIEKHPVWDGVPFGDITEQVLREQKEDEKKVRITVTVHLIDSAPAP